MRVPTWKTWDGAEVEVYRMSDYAEIRIEHRQGDDEVVCIKLTTDQAREMVMQLAYLVVNCEMDTR